MSHIVISLLPGRRFVVDLVSGEPRKVLERWSRNGDERLPVAAFRISDVGAFQCESNWDIGYPMDLYPRDPGRIRRCPLVSEWRRPVQRYAARYEQAAAVLSQLVET